MMESWHVVGQVVTPRDDRPWRDSRSLMQKVLGAKIAPSFGQVCIVSAVEIRRTDNAVMFKLAEMPAHLIYSASAFRPVRPTCIEQFRTLLSPTPDRVRELEDA